MGAIGDPKRRHCSLHLLSTIAQQHDPQPVLLLSLAKTTSNFGLSSLLCVSLRCRTPLGTESSQNLKSFLTPNKTDFFDTSGQAEIFKLTQTNKKCNGIGSNKM